MRKIVIHNGRLSYQYIIEDSKGKKALCSPDILIRNMAERLGFEIELSGDGTENYSVSRREVRSQ